MPPTLEQNQNTTNTTQGEPSIKTDELRPTNLFVLPSQQTPPLATVPDVTSLVAQNEKLFMPDQTAQAERDAAQRGLLQAFNDLGGRADLRAQQENLQGINTKREALNTSNTELQMLQAEQDTLNERLQADSRGRGITAGGLAPIQTAQQRDLAVRTRFAVAKNLAIQGNLDLAQQQVQQAIEDKFADQQTKLANAQSQLSFIQQKINEGAITKTKAVEQALAERNRIIEENQKKINEQKEDQKTIFGWSLVAKHNGASDYQVSQIQNAKDLKSAMQAYLPFSVDPIATQKAVAELQKTRAETGLVNANILKSRAEALKTSNEAVKDLSVSPVEKSKTLDSINLLKTSLISAQELSGASGRSGIRKIAGNFLYGATDFENLTAQTNTIRTNILTLTTDPAIKKFFGPQMSNADVQLMTSAGTTLNPELQNPTRMREELARLADLADRMEKAVSKGEANENGFLVNSNGDKVKISDLTPAQIEEAKKAGFK